jgi:hypothetical protein
MLLAMLLFEARFWTCLGNGMVSLSEPIKEGVTERESGGVRGASLLTFCVLRELRADLDAPRELYDDFRAAVGRSLGER